MVLSQWFFSILVIYYVLVFLYRYIIWNRSFFLLIKFHFNWNSLILIIDGKSTSTTVSQNMSLFSLWIKSSQILCDKQLSIIAIVSMLSSIKSEFIIIIILSTKHSSSSSLLRYQLFFQQTISYHESFKKFLNQVNPAELLNIHHHCAFVAKSKLQFI